MRIIIKIMVLMIKMIEVENVNVVSEGVAIAVRVMMKKLRICIAYYAIPPCALPVSLDQQY